MTHARFALWLGVGLAVLGIQHVFGSHLNELFLRFLGIDKVLHLTGYALVYVVAYAAAGSIARGPRRGALACAAGLMLAFTDETVQRLMPGRSVEGMDLLADVSGLMLGWVVAERPARRYAVPVTMVAAMLGTYVTWTTHARLIDYSRAIQYERLRDFARARQSYERAYLAGLRSAALFNGMAWTELESGNGDTRAAVGYAERALAMEPDSPDILDTYGWALHRAGRSADGLQYLLRAYAVKPDMFCIHYHLGSGYVATGQPTLAEHHFRRQVKRRDTHEARQAAVALQAMAGSR